VSQCRTSVIHLQRSQVADFRSSVSWRSVLAATRSSLIYGEQLDGVKILDMNLINSGGFSMAQAYRMVHQQAEDIWLL
jgi:hypothetical protein